MKLYSQQLELAKVEFYLWRASLDIQDIIIDLARLVNSTPLLVAFIRPYNSPKYVTADIFREVNNLFYNLVQKIYIVLLKELPSYIVLS